MPVKNYTELIVWQKAMNMVEEIYHETEVFPKEETYGLRSQLRKAAVSIPSNIAEGQGRVTTSSFLNHLSIAYGSLREIETQIILSGRLKYLEQMKVDNLLKQCSEVGRLINGLFKSLRIRTS